MKELEVRLPLTDTIAYAFDSTKEENLSTFMGLDQPGWYCFIPPFTPFGPCETKEQAIHECDNYYRWK